MDNKKVPKKYICDKCNYITSRESQWERHVLTGKHKMDKNDKKKVPNKFECECGKTYSYINGLYKHKKKCEYHKKSYCKYFKTSEELFEAVLKDNQEFKKMLIDQIIRYWS